MQKVDRKARSFLEHWLEKTLKQYITHMDKKADGRLHDLIVGGVEKPLVEMVLNETRGNQTQAANILGINRNTLRKKMVDYKIKCKKKA